MLESSSYEEAQEARTGTTHAAQGEGDVPGPGDASVPQAHAEDESRPALEQPEVFENGREPYFPTAEDAIELNQEAHRLYGQPQWGGVLKPNELESAVNSAKQHYYYGPEEDEAERLATAGGKMAWRIAGNQVFGDGNKRTAIWLTRHYLDQNGLGHLSPLDYDDTELADHLVGQDKYGQDTPPEQLGAERERRENLFLDMWRQRYRQGGPNPQYEQQYPEGTYLDPHQSNILDPIRETLDPSVWEDPGSPEPRLRHEHLVWIPKTIFEILDGAGYDNPEEWLTLIFTGSLTTYQYSPQSDCDISLWVDAKLFPEWSRAEMIGLMIKSFDSVKLPGTTHEMQGFVVASKRFVYGDLYKPGLRSAYVIYGKGMGTWLVPPEKDRSHNVEQEENEAYTIALENADKMDRLIRYEPDKALMFAKQIHTRRFRDQRAGKGDYSPSNITWKFLENRGLIPRLNELGAGLPS